MTLNKHLLPSLFLAAVIPFATTAQAAEDHRVGFVNTVKVVDNSPLFADAQRKLKEEFSRREKDLIAKKDQLKKLEIKFESDQAVMSESESKRLERDIIARSRKLKNAQTEFREDLALRSNEERKKLGRRVREVVHQVAKDENIDLVVSDGVVYFSNRIDISDKVLERLKRDAK